MDDTYKKTFWFLIGSILKYLGHMALTLNLVQIASNLTFNTVLAIVPLLAVVLALFTAFPHFQEFSDALQVFMTQSLMPVDLSNNVMAYLNEFAAQASKLTTIGGAFLVVTVMLLIMTIDSALNAIWHVRKLRTVTNRILVYWALISLGPILMGASLWATAYLARESLGLVSQMPAILEFALKTVPVIITGLGLATLFVIVPNCKVNRSDALIGGFISALLLESMKFAFAFYVSRFTTYAVIYGAFAAIPVLLIWIYLSWLAVLVGALITSSMPAIRTNRLNIRMTPGAQLMSALSILKVLAESRGRTPPGKSEQELLECTTQRPEEIGSVLDILSDIGWIARSSDTSQTRWILACNTSYAKFGDLIDKILLDRTEQSFKKNPEIAQALGMLFSCQKDPLLEDVLMHHDKITGQPIQSGEQGSKSEAQHA